MKQMTSLALAFLLLLLPLAAVAQAQSQTSSADPSTKVKSEVTKRVANKKTHVNIELRNGDKLKGRIEQADDNQFTIREDKTGNKIDVSYSDVAKVKGQGLGTGAKIGIVAGIAVGVLAIAVIVALKNFDPFEGGITAR